MQGGWENVRAFGLSVAVTWDAANGHGEWYEMDARKLIGELRPFDRIVTFNRLRFEFQVLSAYGESASCTGRALICCRI